MDKVTFLFQMSMSVNQMLMTVSNAATIPWVHLCVAVRKGSLFLAMEALAQMSMNVFWTCTTVSKDVLIPLEDIDALATLDMN